VLGRGAIVAFLETLRGRPVLIGCGDRRYRQAAEALGDWVAEAFGATAEVTMTGPRATCRYDYMDSFGWPQYGEDPVRADILVGNCQDNGLMWRFVRQHGACGWLPLEINQDFPGEDRCVVMLSLPLVSQANGRPNSAPHPPQLVLGASSPGGVRRGLEALQKTVGR
jgi:hypothetical protein